MRVEISCVVKEIEPCSTYNIDMHTEVLKYLDAHRKSQLANYVERWIPELILGKGWRITITDRFIFDKVKNPSADLKYNPKDLVEEAFFRVTGFPVWRWVLQEEMAGNEYVKAIVEFTDKAEGEV